jgi:hypothetical protein
LTPRFTFYDKYFVKVKINFTQEQTMKAQKGVEVLLHSYYNLDARWGLTPLPGLFVPWKETQYPLHRRLGGSHGRSGRVLKISPPTEFDV